MDNMFVARLFDWDRSHRGRGVSRANAVLRWLHIPWTVRRAMNPFIEMTTLEQRLNLWNLAVQPLAGAVPGDLVELGCYDGKTAVIFARVIEQFAPDRQLHLYDHFSDTRRQGRDIQRELRTNFQTAGCRQPVVHAGEFAQTVPDDLPERIAFAHIDCGTGGDVREHKALLMTLLPQVYARMPPGAIAVLMDYHDAKLCTGHDHNPAVAQAVDEFLADKPEKAASLWGGEYTHGYFRRK